MIKGVNKKIIEINNPDSIYFEKAVFYLRPEVMELPQQVAEEEIERYVSKLGIATQSKKRNFLGVIMTVACICALITTVTILFF